MEKFKQPAPAFVVLHRTLKVLELPELKTGGNINTVAININNPCIRKNIHP